MLDLPPIYGKSECESGKLVFYTNLIPLDTHNLHPLTLTTGSGVPFCFRQTQFLTGIFLGMALVGYPCPYFSRIWRIWDAHGCPLVIPLNTDTGCGTVG
jgi:hypothetical protein